MILVFSDVELDFRQIYVISKHKKQEEIKLRVEKIERGLKILYHGTSLGNPISNFCDIIRERLFRSLGDHFSHIFCASSIPFSHDGSY